MPTQPAPTQSGGETARHRLLKTLALAWARDQGFSILGSEVSFPHRRFRFDVAAFRPKFRVPEKVDFSAEIGATAVFECKQARSDLIKDNRIKAGVGEKLRGLYRRKNKLEELLKVHLPHLARGEELFPEFDSYRLDESGHKTYARVVRSIRETQSAYSLKTKFDRLYRYRLANLHYIVAEAGIAAAHEIPLGWGHLVLEDGILVLKQAPAWQATCPRAQYVFLQRIALATSGAALRATPASFSVG